MKKILFIHVVGDPGGATKSLWYLVNGLDRNQFVPEVLFARRGRMIDEFVRLGIKVDVIRLGQLRNTSHSPLRFNLETILMIGYFLVRLPIDVFAVSRLVRKEKIDIVHINVAPLISAAIGSKLGGAKVVWHIREVFNPNFVGKLQVSSIGMLADAIVAVSQHGSAPFRRRDKVHVVYNGLNLRDAIPKISSRDVRRSARTSDSDIVYLIIGNLTPTAAHAKGFYDFLQAAAITSSRREDVVFWVVGDSPTPGNLGVLKASILRHLRMKVKTEREHIQFEAEQLGIGLRVRFLGHKSEVYSYIGASDVVVAPHRMPEPFGRTLIEAGAMRKALITTNLPPTTEIIEDQKTGLLVSPSNANDLSKAMLELADDKGKRSSLGNALHEEVKKRFLTTQVDTQLRIIYQQVCSS